ncbi:hypothetical protein [Kangiella sp.]|uniref:hypothetical protein n=1 Tax=Kangiella sp. TaxID=1920245 RepID=UPI003A95AC17
MKQLALALFSLGFFASTLQATKTESKSLEELVLESDLIVEVFVVDVYEKNAFEAIIRNPEMETGPSIENRIILNVCVKDVFYKDKSIDVPSCFEVSLWKRWHLSLGSILEYKSKEVLLLLKGEDLKFVHPGHFFWPLDKKDEILELNKKRDTQ